jgi:hypothetical protein
VVDHDVAGIRIAIVRLLVCGQDSDAAIACTRRRVRRAMALWARCLLGALESHVYYLV